MVEKISEPAVKVALNRNPSSAADKDTLLTRIAKKKKEQYGEEIALPAALALPPLPVRPASASGGGLQVSAKGEKRESAPVSPQVGLTRQSESGDHQRRQTILAAAAVSAAPGALKAQRQPVAAGSSPPPRAGEKEAIKNPEIRDTALTHKAQPVTTGNAHQQLQASHPTPAVSVAIPESVRRAGSLTETERRQPRSEDQGEAKPLFQGTLPAQASGSQQAETPTRSKHLSATPTQLQQRMAQANGVDAVIKPGATGRTVEVDYPFQRWSGDHSVRVSIPAESRRQGNITLLPSDPRAAELLSRNMEHLASLAPALLLPPREQDERDQRQRQQQQQQQQQEEDQE